MSQTTGEFLVSRLHEWGIRTIFGYSGDGINGVLRGFVKQGAQFDFVQARHEEMAAFMACGFAKFRASSASASPPAAQARATC